jgi:hypothetical protein
MPFTKKQKYPQQIEFSLDDAYRSLEKEKKQLIKDIKNMIISLRKEFLQLYLKENGGWSESAIANFRTEINEVAKDLDTPKIRDALRDKMSKQEREDMDQYKPSVTTKIKAFFHPQQSIKVSKILALISLKEKLKQGYFNGQVEDSSFFKNFMEPLYRPRLEGETIEAPHEPFVLQGVRTQQLFIRVESYVQRNAECLNAFKEAGLSPMIEMQFPKDRGNSLSNSG